MTREYSGGCWLGRLTYVDNGRIVIYPAVPFLPARQRGIPIHLVRLALAESHDDNGETGQGLNNSENDQVVLEPPFDTEDPYEQDGDGYSGQDGHGIDSGCYNPRPFPDHDGLQGT